MESAFVFCSTKGFATLFTTGVMQHWAGALIVGSRSALHD